MTALTVPATGGAGAPITVSDVTTNQGGGSVGPTTTRFYLSADGALDVSDTLLASRDVGALDGGGASSGSTTVTIPAVDAGGHLLHRGESRCRRIGRGDVRRRTIRPLAALSSAATFTSRR